MYKCKNFKIFELVPPEIMTLPEDYLWELFDENLLRVIDRLREDLKRPITINTWKNGVVRALKKYIPDGTAASEASCPECGAKGGLIYKEGCLACKHCGYSKCG